MDTAGSARGDAAHCGDAQAERDDVGRSGNDETPAGVAGVSMWCTPSDLNREPTD